MLWLFYSALLTALLAIISSGWRAPLPHWLSKPTATALLSLWVILNGHGDYALGIAIGLACCAIGDLFLMLSARWFSAGLAAFLIGHLFYAAVFLLALPATPGLMNLIPLLIGAAVIQHFLWAGAAGQRMAIIVYTLALVAMTWLAQELWRFGRPGGVWIALGSLCFMTSDGLLAWNRFVNPLPRAQYAVLGSYFPAQLMIAWGSVALSL